jgi:hypothetical protein
LHGQLFSAGYLLRNLDTPITDDPLNPKYPYVGILGAFLNQSTSPSNDLAALAKSTLAGGVASDLFPKPQPAHGLGALSDLFSPPLFAPKAAIKRRAFFSFYYEDIMRVNVVRNAWRIHHPDNALMRSFQDSSLWESKKLECDDTVKRLIREGVEYTSAVCVLIGSETWLRRWVRYEIARAVVDGRGLIAVHLNSIPHHQTRTAHSPGLNPLDHMAVGKVQEAILSPAKYYLFEKRAVRDRLGGYKWEWHRYQDYTSTVNLPIWLNDPAPRYVTPLSSNAFVYNYITDDGHKNIGSWIDLAAQRTGR